MDDKYNYAMGKLNKASEKIKKQMNDWDNKKWKEKKYDYAYQGIKEAYNVILELQEETEAEFLKQEKIDNGED